MCVTVRKHRERQGLPLRPDRKSYAGDAPQLSVEFCSPCGTFDPGPPAPFGVVIGSYKWPSLVDLQIRLIHDTCGKVPILVSSDHPETAAEITDICNDYHDVTHRPNPERIGHTGGDISAFYKAVKWGASRQMQCVAKLSQRFLVTRKNWLQDGAADLGASRLAMASQRCTGTQRFDLRTEAVLIDVAQWNNPDVLERIKPRRYWNDVKHGLSAETVIYRVLQDLLGEFYLPWALFGESRDTKYDGVVWHCSHTLRDYQELAYKYGVKLDAGFHCSGWQYDLSKGQYLYG